MVRYQIDARPIVSVVMPVFNEEAFIERSLDAIDAQTYPADQIEIAVVDGGSSDGTLAIAGDRAAADLRIRILGGPGTNTPTAMNVGIAATTGPYVAKVDGHGWINQLFLAEAVRILEDEPTVGCVGGEIIPVATTEVGIANRIARFSKFGVGGGVYTAARVQHDADTVQCGVYRRSVLAAIGGFDPALQFGEDEEVNHRVRKAGSRIVFLPTMRFTYVVRPTLGSLLLQYTNYGRARVAVVRKHPSFLRVKHLAPAGLLIGLVASAALALAGEVWALGVPLAYGLGLIAIATGLSARHRFGQPWLVAASLLCLHVGYGLGTIVGVGDVLRPAK